MMLPTLDLSASTRHYRPQVYHREHDPRLLSQSFNGPEENDETLGEDPPPSANSDSCSEWRSVGPAPDRPSSVAAQHYLPYQPPIGLPAAFTALTPYPSHAHRSQSSLESHMDGWHPSSIASSFLQGGCSSSLPSSPPSVGSCSDCLPGPGERSQSLPSHSIPGVDSLEQPGSLRSIPPGASGHNYCLPLYPCGPRAPVCCRQSPAEPHRMGPMSHHKPWLDCRGLYGPMGPHPCRCHDGGFSQSRHQPPQPRQKLFPPSTPLSLEQRRLFVTYEADSEMHEKEVIRFAALLRHNGFDVHIDVFEQQFRSISKIDFMEKFISEKDYLIIIAISPKYYETVTYSHMNMENDERTLITVYIHKQLQNEFIQNGSRNFRFIPILFPGAKKCHVPTWLQNTHVYSWPLDRDDILRRLMRVEKYNPPPIGELPTIVSIPL